MNRYEAFLALLSIATIILGAVGLVLNAVGHHPYGLALSGLALIGGLIGLREHT